MAPTLKKLPIDPHLPGILAELETSRSLVLQASPGSGKTTRLPPALLSKLSGEIWVLEPRRLAAKLAAKRVAEELGTRVGEVVGYQFRFESAIGKNTRLLYLTEGMLIRRLISNPELDGVSAVILDEFHERHLHTDVALAYLKALQSKRPDLKLVVMSATLQTGELETFLNKPAKASIDAPAHPVDVIYLAPPSGAAPRLEAQVKSGVTRALELLEGDPGDLLVFLPGMADIRRAEGALGDFSRELEILTLHGELTREEQDRALTPGSRRRVILSTNVAESSVTLEGIRGVIDSGLHREASYSPWSGIPTLRTRKTSRASAIQRAGRAGRTGPGFCIRLYSKGEFDERAPFSQPEILRADLTQTYLEIARMGRSWGELPWISPAPLGAIEAARHTLWRIGALESEAPDARITELGKRLAEFPAHPRVGRLCLEGAKLGVLSEAATLGALLAEDELESLDAIEGALKASKTRLPGPLSRVREQLERAAGSPAKPAQDPAIALARAAFAAFPDRAATKKDRGTECELLLASGGSVMAPKSATLDASDAFVVLDIRERQAHGQRKATRELKAVSPITLDWALDLDPSPVAEVDEHFWDPARGKVLSRRRLTLDAITLDETVGPATDPEAASLVFLKAALEWEKIPPLESLSRIWTEEVAHAEFARLAFARRVSKDPAFVEISLPSERAAIDALAARLIAGQTSLVELRGMDLAQALADALGPEKRALLDRLAPRDVALPGGRRTKIHYEFSQDPWIASRLQDFFGMKTGPRVGGGAVPLTLQLLAPNQRPVQVTRDLESFWKNIYPEIRGQLSRRYPRHKWPEKPE